MVPRNLYELWVVATRPVTLNGFGMSVSDASLLQEKCFHQFRLLRDEREIFDHWTQIVSSTPTAYLRTCVFVFRRALTM